MKWVSPIKDPECLEYFLDELRAMDVKYYILFQIGVGTGMLLQDILKLKVLDVKGQDFLEVFIGSKKIRRVFQFPQGLKKELEDFTADRNQGEPLFLGYQNSGSPLSREQVYRVFRKAGKTVGLPDIGAQTMRKTFAWNYYKDTGDIAYIQKLLSHASSSITYQYIGESLKNGEREEPIESRELNSSLRKDGNGRQRIEKLKHFLNNVERNLDNPEKGEEYFEAAEYLISRMESLAAEFKKKSRKRSNKK